MSKDEHLFDDWIEAERKAVKAERLLSDESTRDRWMVTSAPSPAREQAMLLRAEASAKLRCVIADLDAALASIRREWAQRPLDSQATTRSAARPPS